MYIALYKALHRRAHASAILPLRANNERFENNLIDRRPPVRVHPSTFDLFSKTLAEIILRRRRARASARTPPLVIFTSLYLSSPPPACVSPPLLATVLRLMQSESVGLSSASTSSSRSRFVLAPLLGHPLARGHEAGVEKLSPRFHPNVTDLTSRGDAARFPRIIILLSYNSFNGRASKTGEGEECSNARPGRPPPSAFLPPLCRVRADRVRRAFALRFK